MSLELNTSKPDSTRYTTNGFTSEIQNDSRSKTTPTTYDSFNTSNTIQRDFDKENPCSIVFDDDDSCTPRGDRTLPAKDGTTPISEKLSEKLGKLAEEIADKQGFLKDNDIENVVDGKMTEEQLLIQRVKQALKESLGDGDDINPALDIMNKKLQELKSPYLMKATPSKFEGEKGFNIDLVDKETGEMKDRFLMTTWNQNEIDQMGDQFGSGKFLSEDELEKTISGDMRVKDTMFGKLMERIQEAHKNGQDPKKIVDALNKHLKDSKSKFKLDAEYETDGVYLELRDRESDSRSDKMKVPFRPLTK